MSHDPLLGALLSDRFRIVRKLPIESLNELYEGEDVSQRRRVLVKFIYRGYLNTQRAEARFREEMTAVRELESQHVTRVFDLGVTEEGGPFHVLALELPHRPHFFAQAPFSSAEHTSGLQ